MDATHPLKMLLQLQLASDSYAVLYLPYVLKSLSADYFLPSSHLSKWTTRIYSLMHSKEPGSRWSGLCIAHKTSVLSKGTMIECAQSWMGVALPMLAKSEPQPTLKAAVRLLTQIFTSATDVPEFQRQVATPNILKFSLALITLAEKATDTEIKVLALKTLSAIVPLYPTLHRASYGVLSTTSLNFLNGTTPTPCNHEILEAASGLYAVLHFTGGKVGAANLWRKSVDETLAVAQGSFLNLRSTFSSQGNLTVIETAHPVPSVEDPFLSKLLNLDRLRCCTTVLGDLLRSPTVRPVQIPLGALNSFIISLLSCTAEDKAHGYVDSAIHAMELSILPEIWKLCCELITCLSICAGHHLLPCLTQLLSYITFHLEQNITSTQRLTFLHALRSLLANSHPIHAPLLFTRLAKAILPSLSVILQPDSRDSVDATGSAKGKKGKKRVRGYEGDELFTASRAVICPTDEDGEVILASLDVMHIVLHNRTLSPAVQSIASRVLLSLLLTLPQMAPTALATDLTLHKRLVVKVEAICTQLGSASTSAISKSLPLVIQAAAVNGHRVDSGPAFNVERAFELLLHPRLPPLVRSLPHVESLSLFRAEESQEEIDIRQSLSLEFEAQELPLLEAPSSTKGNSVPDPIPASPKAPTLSSQMTQSQIVSSNVRLDTTVQAKPQASPPATTAPSIPAPVMSRVTKSAAVTEPWGAITVDIADDDEDEPIPAINMDSDSD